MNEVIAYSPQEGVRWIPWTAHNRDPDSREVHALKFEDGAVWDTWNGYRPAAPEGFVTQEAFDKMEKLYMDCFQRSERLCDALEARLKADIENRSAGKRI